ncbi:MAG: ABC transporter ATP-binding protein [bacterium]|nr:ABC transporter ATP-binding protein [bacterium]
MTTPTASIPMYDLKQAVTTSKARVVGLLKMMSGYQWFYVGAILSLVLAAIGRAGGFLLIGWFVDDLLRPLPQFTDMTALAGLNAQSFTFIRPDLASLIPLVALGYLFLALVEGSFNFLRGRWAAYTAENVVWRIKNYVYDHLQRLTFGYHDRMQTGELLQRSTSDVDAVRRFYAEELVELGRIAILFSVNFIAIMTLNVSLALISVVILPLLAIVSVYFFRKISKKYEEFQEREAELSTTLQENLSGVRVVKAFARQQYEEDKFEKHNAARYKSGRQLLRLHAAYWPLTDLITGAQLITGLVIAAILASDGVLTVGDYISYAGMIGALINPMRQLGRLVVAISQGLVSYDRLAEIVRETREELGENVPAPVTEIRGEVVFENVMFEYDKDTPVLHNINFTCKPGETIALLGSTGSGKTTLVTLLGRFYEYTTGRILLDGIDLKQYPKSFLRKNVGVVQQEAFLFSRTIRENITLGVDHTVTDEEVIAVAKAAAIHDSIMSFPEGYKTLVGERGVTLSGGQKQRVALARILLKNPALLILDDATSAVDTETEAHIRNALREMNDKRTTFIIAHRITTVMHADKILVLDKGRIVQMGTHEELVNQPGIYQRTYEMQARIEDELEKELANV